MSCTMESRLHSAESTSEQLIAAYLEKARQKLGVARRLRDSGDHDDAVSRAYYAAFHAAKALLPAPVNSRERITARSRCSTSCS